MSAGVRSYSRSISSKVAAGETSDDDRHGYASATDDGFSVANSGIDDYAIGHADAASPNSARESTIPIRCPGVGAEASIMTGDDDENGTETDDSYDRSDDPDVEIHEAILARERFLSRW
jgi:hypothetical protein